MDTVIWRGSLDNSLTKAILNFDRFLSINLLYTAFAYKRLYTKQTGFALPLLKTLRYLANV
jgi:hypothetical protein